MVVIPLFVFALYLEATAEQSPVHGGLRFVFTNGNRSRFLAELPRYPEGDEFLTCGRGHLPNLGRGQKKEKARPEAGP